eukprot:g38845.t1
MQRRNRKPRKKACQWLAEEDEKILNCVNELKKHPKHRNAEDPAADGDERLKIGFWKDLAMLAFQDSKNAKQCRERWNRKLDPRFKQPEVHPFSEEQDQHILSQFRAIGPRWVRIGAPILRSGPMVKTRYRKLKLIMFQVTARFSTMFFTINFFSATCWCATMQATRRGPPPAPGQLSGLSSSASQPAQRVASAIAISTSSSSYISNSASSSVSSSSLTSSSVRTPVFALGSCSGPVQPAASDGVKFSSSSVLPRPVQPLGGAASESTYKFPAAEARSPVRTEMETPQFSPAFRSPTAKVACQLFPEELQNTAANAFERYSELVEAAMVNRAVAMKSPKSRKSKSMTVTQQRPLKQIKTGSLDVALHAVGDRQTGSLDVALHAVAAAEGMTKAASWMRKLAKVIAEEIDPQEAYGNELDTVPVASSCATQSTPDPVPVASSCATQSTPDPADAGTPWLNSASYNDAENEIDATSFEPATSVSSNVPEQTLFDERESYTTFLENAIETDLEAEAHMELKSLSSTPLLHSRTFSQREHSNSIGLLAEDDSDCAAIALNPAAAAFNGFLYKSPSILQLLSTGEICTRMQRSSAQLLGMGYGYGMRYGVWGMGSGEMWDEGWGMWDVGFGNSCVEISSSMTLTSDGPEDSE